MDRHYNGLGGQPTGREGRSRAIAAGPFESHHERPRCDEAVTDRPRVIRIRTRVRPKRFWSPWRMLASGSTRNRRRDCSRRSIRRSPKGWAWVCPSAARSLKRTAESCGRRRMRAPARRFSSPCRSRKEGEREACPQGRRPHVFVVDDDASVREALSSLIRSVGLRVEVFSSAREFLRKSQPTEKADAPRASCSTCACRV